MSNPLHWPEIEQLPEFLDGILEGYFYQRDVPLEQDMRKKKKRLTKEQLERIFFEVSWVGNVKYDGTTLAIANDGQYYGRRQLITGTSYQKKDISFLKDYNVNNLYNDLMAPFLEKNVQFFFNFILPNPNPKSTRLLFAFLFMENSLSTVSMIILLKIIIVNGWHLVFVLIAEAMQQPLKSTIIYLPMDTAAIH